jgi:hypothetical protein
MKFGALTLAFLTALARPLQREAPEKRDAIFADMRERGRFRGSLRGSIKSERGLSRGLHLLANLSRMGRG